MFPKSEFYVSVPLVEMAEREFPNLMRHRTNREDALQVLRIAQWQTKGVEALVVARAELERLECDLGLSIPVTVEADRSVA